MARIEHSVDIAGPIDLVFAALTDPRRAVEWNPHVVEVTDVSDGVVRQGTTWRQKAVLLSRPEDFLCRVAEYDPPHFGVLEISGAHDARIITRCESTGVNTHVLQVMEFEVPGGIFGRVASAFVSERLKRELVETMERQRLALDKEVKNGPGTSE